MTERVLQEMTFEISQHCLNRCIYCSSVVGRHNPHPPLPMEVIRTVLQQAAQLGLSTLSLSGGEPFLHPNIEEIMAVCSHLGLRELKVYTCGIVLGAGQVAPLGTDSVVTAKQAGATLVFNIQSTQVDVYDRLSGRIGRFDVAMASLRKAIDCGIPVECHIVPNKINLDSLSDTAHQLLDMGVKRVSFLRLVPQGNAVDNWACLGLDQEDLAQLRALLGQLHSEPQSECKYRFGVPFSEVSSLGQTCQAGISKVLVRWDGLCFPCEAFKECGDGSFAIGNILVNTVAEILCEARGNWRLQTLKTLSREEDVCPAQALYSKAMSREGVRVGV